MDLQRELEKIREAKMDASKQPDLQHQMEAFLCVRYFGFLCNLQENALKLQRNVR